MRPSIQAVACVAATANWVLAVLDSADQAGALAFLSTLRIAGLDNVSTLICRPGEEVRMIRLGSFDFII